MKDKQKTAIFKLKCTVGADIIRPPQGYAEHKTITIMNQLPTRKKNRFENITYTENGVYFITICSKDKKCIFSKIIPGADESLAPEIRLSKTGEIINTAINEIGNHYDNVSVVNYVIMPNHIHLLISIGDSGGRMISGLACRLGRRFSPRAEVSTGDPRPYGRRKP